MAIEYVLYIANYLSEDDITDILRTSGASDTIIGIAKPNVTRTEIIEEELGFTPSISVTFQLDKFGNLQAMKQAILCGVINVSKQFEGDFALVFNGEEVLLLRTAGSLVRNSNPDLWTTDDLVALTVPHATEYIPTL